MDRKEFLRKVGVASGCMLVFQGGRAGATAAGRPQQEGDMSHRKKFKEAWILSLMENLEEQLGEDERSRLMEACGRACARRSSVRKLAESCQGKVEKLVGGLADFLGKENCYVEDNTVFLKYDKCYCELVDKGPERLPNTYCLCSRGWVVEMFETAAQRPVKVEILKSIKRGDPHCEFTVQL